MGVAQVLDGQCDNIVVLVSPTQGPAVTAPVGQAGSRFVDGAFMLAGRLEVT